MENEGAGMNQGMVSMIVTPGGVIAIEPTPTAVVVKAFHDANIDFDVFVNGQPAGASSGSTGRLNRASAFLKSLIWALVIVAISCGLSFLPETMSDISASLPASFRKVTEPAGTMLTETKKDLEREPSLAGGVKVTEPASSSPAPPEPPLVVRDDVTEPSPLPIPPAPTTEHSAILPASVLKDTEPAGAMLSATEPALNVPDVLRGLIDEDAVACTTNRLDYLFAYKADPSSSMSVFAKDKTEHRSHGFGYLKVPDSSPQGFHMVHCHYTPSIPTTILPPDAIARAAGCQGYDLISNPNGSDGSLTLRHCHGSSQNPLGKPTHDERRATSLPV